MSKTKVELDVKEETSLEDIWQEEDRLADRKTRFLTKIAEVDLEIEEIATKKAKVIAILEALGETNLERSKSK